DVSKFKQLLEIGRSLRNKAKFKVRQPLPLLVVVTNSESYFSKQFRDQLIKALKHELNVKEIEFKTRKVEKVFNNRSYVKQRLNDEYTLYLFTELSLELEQEGCAREVIRRIQQLRKNLNLAIDDRILISFNSEESVIKDSIDRFRELIMTETLAKELNEDQSLDEFQFSINRKSLYLKIEK
ncbi:MAG: DUF5915 domain-containing protein, partial [Candidatus Hodarchaeales archaeon]